MLSVEQWWLDKAKSSITLMHVRRVLCHCNDILCMIYL